MTASPGAAEYLDLLAREASAVEFEGPVLAARAAGASAEALEALEKAKLVALRVRATLARRARRGAELSALFQTAGDLAELRDLDAVLDAIVSRARQLLDTDVAYMTLYDEDRDDNYMRVTDGSASASFQQLRLPMGAGLGGLVAQSATPYATADYFADARFDHLRTINDAVREEGLVAILGVPLRLGSRVIGVLFAADRSARPFVQEEVALLGSFAAHAAIAIDNARLLEGTRAALDELSAANKVVQAHSNAVERAALAHDRMMDLVLRGGGVADVAAMVTEVIGGSLLVLDSGDRPLTTVGAVGTLESGVYDTAQTARALGRSVRRGELTIASVDVGSEPLCTLVLRTAEDVSDTDQRILERAALVTALLLLERRSVAEAEDRFRGELLDDLISRDITDAAALRERGRRLGVDLDRPHVLVVARHDGPRERVGFWASAQATAERGLATAGSTQVALLLPGEDPGKTARRVAAELSSVLGRPVTAGACGPIAALGDVAAAHKEAQRCADTLVALGRTGHGASATDLGFVGLLIGDHRDVDAFLDGTIGPVVAYDTRRGTDLVHTVDVYFGHGGSPARTAQTLHIHVNTVAQRLERVGRLLGEDWQSPERALEIQLALRLHRLRRT